MPLSYDESLLFLESLRRNQWRQGLDRMQAAAERMGVAHGGSPRYVHVAGTNGKGSTTGFVQSILSASGLKTGSYFSPYVYDMRERIQVDGQLVSKEEFAAAVSQVAEIASEFDGSELGALTEFEAKTLAGFAHWNRSGCEYVALETGLGGRLDSTNIVQPVSCAITSIALDHVGVLGDTIEQIAAEKAGIIKPGVPVVTGRLPAAALAVVDAKAAETGSKVWALGRDMDWTLSHEDEFILEGSGLQTTINLPFLPGQFQIDNAAVAVMASRLADRSVTERSCSTGVRSFTLPGRFQIVRTSERTWVLDGAHNQQSAETLADTFFEVLNGGEADLVYGALEGHDPTSVLRALRRISKRIFIVPIHWAKAVPSDELAAAARSLGCEAVVCDSAELAVSQVSAPRVVVTGSFYVLGEVARAAGLDVFPDS